MATRELSWDDVGAPVEAAPAAPAAQAPTNDFDTEWDALGTPVEMPAEPEGPTLESFGLPMATSRDEAISGLRTLTQRRAPPNIVREYLQQSGLELSPENETFLDEAYPQMLERGGEDPLNVRWEAVEPEQPEQPQGPSPVMDAPFSVMGIPMSLRGLSPATWEGLKSSALFGFGDELQGFSGAVGNKLGTALGLNDSTADFGDIYDQIVQEARQERDQAWEDDPLGYSLGFLPGLLTGGGAISAGVRGLAPNLGRYGHSAAVGAGEGAISGAGSADDSENVLNRLDDAALWGVVGGALGPVGDVAVRAAGRPISAAFNRVVRGGSPDSGLEALSRRTELDPEQMRAAAEEMRAGGVDPRLVDVVDEEARTVLRQATTAPTPARREVARHAEAVEANFPGRVAEQAERIGPAGDRRTAGDIERTIVGTPDELGERDVVMGQMMDPIRQERLPITDEMKMVLGSDEGQAALRGAMRLMTDFEEREAVKRVLAAARKAARGPTDPEDAFRAEVKGWDDLPDALKDAYRAQRPDLAPSDPFEGLDITVDTADKFARAMKGAATRTPGLERVANEFSRVVRNSARQAYPQYDEALKAYEAASGVAEAAAGRGRFENTDFLTSRPDDFAAATSRASTEPGAVNVAIGTEQVRPSPLSPELSDEATIDWMEGRGMAGFSAQGRLDPDEQRVHDLIIQDILASGEDVTGSTYYRGMSMTPEQLDDFINNPVASRRAVSYAFDEELAADFASAGSGRVGVLMEVVMGDGTRAKTLANTDVVDEVVTGPGTYNIIDVESMGPDSFRIKAEFVPDPLPTREITEPTVSERDALRARARDDTQARALEGSGQGAEPLARQMAHGDLQRQRTETLIGPEEAERVRAGMAAETARLDNTRSIDPRAGTRMRAEARRLDGFEQATEAAMAAGTGNKWWLARIADRWLRQGGIRNVDAERLARDAINENPERLEAAISYLERRGMHRENARRFMQILGASLAGRAGPSDDTPNAPRPPANSVRAIYRESGR